MEPSQHNRGAMRLASRDINDLPHEVWPLDIAILKALPNEDQMLGGYHYVGRRVKDIADELDDGSGIVTSSQVNSRMRVLRANALAVMRPASGGKVWQRTYKGVELLVQRGELPPLTEIPAAEQVGHAPGDDTGTPS